MDVTSFFVQHPTWRLKTVRAFTGDQVVGRQE